LPLAYAPSSKGSLAFGATGKSASTFARSPKARDAQVKIRTKVHQPLLEAQPLLPLLAVSQRQEVAFQPLLPLLAVSQRQEVAFQRQERQERQELFRQAQVKIRTKGNRATGLVYGALTLVIPSCLTKRYKLFTLLNKIH